MSIESIDDIKRSFRTPSLTNYPELVRYSRNEIYNGKMGPGGLFLAAAMTRRITQVGKLRILDLGCGRGATSQFLADAFDATVFALDLWIDASANNQSFVAHGYDGKIIPLHLNVENELPFALEYFDVIFCMDCVHYFGGQSAFWKRILGHLKPGGDLCIGSPCFTNEFTESQLRALPHEFDDGTAVWPKEFSKYHSPDWWARVVEDSGMVTHTDSFIADDGEIFWEDDVLHSLETQGDAATALVDARQIRCRVDGYPHLTHFILNARKRNNMGTP